MSDQSESSQEYNNMSPKSGKDDKANKTGPSTLTTEAVEEDLNGKANNSSVRKEV